MDNAHIRELEKYVNSKAYNVFKEASNNCRRLREEASLISNQCLRDCGIPLDKVCVVAVGSLGRFEALEASDIDLIPILLDKGMIADFGDCDRLLRKTITDRLNIKVSKGEDLTRADSISEFADSKLIGSDSDSVTHLTKRVLILTEAVSIGGEMAISSVRREILRGYSDMDRTRGRHVLSLVNDIARYFRTLCIEYKGKVDSEEKDWSTRNMKLRYSRKFWYFANIVAISSLAERHPRGERAYEEGLLNIFDLPPYMRLLEQIGQSHPIEVGRILECFSFFLEFMACPKRRAALDGIAHGKRYAVEIGNPFPGLKHNSDLMHCYMVDMFNGMSVSARRRIIDWFLL